MKKMLKIKKDKLQQFLKESKKTIPSSKSLEKYLKYYKMSRK